MTLLSAWLLLTFPTTRDHLIADVPALPLFLSSHATTAASVLDFHGLRPAGMPDAAFIGGLAAQMYRCDCERNLDYWEVAGGSNGGGGFI